MPDGIRAATVALLQRGYGNAAVTRELSVAAAVDAPHSAERSDAASRMSGTTRATLQRVGPVEVEPPPGTALLEKLDQMSDADKVDELRKLVIAGGSSQEIALLWASFGERALEVARSQPALFKTSLDRAGMLVAELAPFKTLSTKFKADVEAMALGYLTANRSFIAAEMDKLGGHGTEVGEPNAPTAEQQHQLHAIQQWGKLLAEAERALAGLRAVAVGYEAFTQDRAGGGFTTKYAVATFSPAAPPMYRHKPLMARIDDAPEIKPWEEVKKNWDDVSLIKAICEQRSPALAVLAEQSGKTEDFGEADLATARKEIGTALLTLTTRIDAAVPLVGYKIDYTDLVPIHNQLFSGTTGASGTNWGSPVEQAVARQYVKRAGAERLMVALGLGALSAAMFILAPYAEMPLGAIMVSAGVGASASQAAMSWDRYAQLSTAQQATGATQRFAIVSKEQADSALFQAVLDTASALIDVAGARAAVRAGAAGRELLEVAEAGASDSAAFVLRNLGREGLRADVVNRALLELGPHETQRISNRSFRELAAIVGEKTESGARLLALAELGAEAAQKTAVDALEALKKLRTLPAEEANRTVLQALDHLGYIATVREGGGFKAVTQAVGERSAAAQTLEEWRRGLFEELQRFLSESTTPETKAIRTGTEKATSDLDVQVVGGAAAFNAEKAEQWLAGRLGCGKHELKELLDATIFVDPTRAHLYDVVHGLRPADREAIAAVQSGLEQRLILGARLAEADARGDAAAAKKIVAEAAERGVSDLKPFTPFSPEAQAQLAGEIDELVRGLAGAGPVQRAETVAKIGEKQALINASHPDAYLGGGVRFWVTGRAGDVEKFKAAGVKMLGGPSDVQRIISALSEGKFFDEAISTMTKPRAEIDKVAAALKDLGKHGSRAGAVVSGGQAASSELMIVASRMELLATAAKKPQMLQQLANPAEMKRLVEHAQDLLVECKNEVAAAIGELERTAKIVQISFEELERLRFWTSFRLKFAAVADTIHASLPAALKAWYRVVRHVEVSEAHADEPSEAPAVRPPIEEVR